MEGLSDDDFRDYYENQHAPLASSLLSFEGYERNYVNSGLNPLYKSLGSISIFKYQSMESLDVVGKSSFYYSDSHDNKSKSYSLTNINYQYFSGQWTYTLWARNVFDTYYSVRGFYFGNEAPNFEDTLYERHGDPRHIGISIRYDF